VIDRDTAARLGIQPSAIDAALYLAFGQNQVRTGGKTPEEAIYQACVLRFRPIMMTTTAALLAGLPLALGAGNWFGVALPARDHDRRRPDRQSDIDTVHDSSDLSLPESLPASSQKRSPISCEKRALPANLEACFAFGNGKESLTSWRSSSSARITSEGRRSLPEVSGAPAT
jgi:hypothetical protein